MSFSFLKHDLKPLQNKAVISEAFHLKTEALRISIFEKIQSYEWEIMLKLNQPPQGHHVSPEWN